MKHLAEPKPTDRLCIALLATEIECAFTLLRLAEAEARGGKAAHASELIEKASLAYKSVVARVNNLPVELAEERGELHEHAQRLLELLSRRHDGFEISFGETVESPL